MTIELQDLRQQISNLDQQIHELLQERFRLTEQVAHYKKAKGLALKDSAQEQRIFQALKMNNEDQQHMKRIFQSILDESLKKMKAQSSN